MDAGKLALRAVVLATILVWVQAASAQGADNLANATCLGCHGVSGFAAPRADGQTRSLFVPADQFANSVHGKALRCIDCHTTIAELPHKNVSKTLAEWDRTRLAIAKNCINCHAKAAQGYTETYHGQVIVMGFADGATCSDCHGSHAILRASDPASSVAPANLLKTCQKCHQDATAGFATFQPHATTDDFARYPYTWLASKFVNVAVGGVLLFFWIHSALWFYREYRDRQQQKLRPHVRADALPQGEGRYYQRWSAMWRWAHLLFAISIILLVATGVTLLYPNTAWAPLLERAMGGPENRRARASNRGRGHGRRLCLAHRLCRHPHRAELEDLQSVRALFADAELAGRRATSPPWSNGLSASGRGRRSTTGTISRRSITGRRSGASRCWSRPAPCCGSRRSPRPTCRAGRSTWPRSPMAMKPCSPPPISSRCTISSITGGRTSSRSTSSCSPASMPLEEFKREYAVEYARLAESGQLEQHLVDAPSRPLTLGSKILGFGLVAVGLALLVMMAIGFGGNFI